MIYAEIYATEDESAAEAIATHQLLSPAQQASFTLVASGNGTIKGAIAQAHSYIEVGPYKAVRVVQGKSQKKVLFQGYAKDMDKL